MRIFREVRPATLQDVSWLRRAMCAELENLRLKPALIDDLAIVVSEVGANLVAHSNPAATFVDVEVELTGAALTIHVRDDGGPFNDFNVRRVKQSASLLDESGRGLTLVQSALDRTRYKAGKPNILTGWRSLGSSRPCVLVLEDTPGLLDLYSTYLDAEYNVIGCSSLAEARLVMQTAGVDVILADLHLGDGSSSILLDEPGGSGDLDPPPIVFISSDHGTDVREECLGHGAEFFIAKPVQAGNLRRTLALAITRAGVRSARLSRMFARHVDALIDNLLPAEVGGYRTACIGASASAGGGDIVMRFPMREAERIIIADVMGHGVAARAWAISLSATMRTLQNYKPELNCGGFLSELARLTWDDPALQGAMATVLVADLEASGVTFASAGHPMPFVVGAEITRMDAGGPLLGVVAPMTYGTAHAAVASGDRLVLFTDGVDHRDETGGDCLPLWIEETLRSHARDPLAATAQELGRSAQAKLGPQPSDDWTLVVLEKI